MAYDHLYRCQALARHSLDWAQEDSTLIIEASVGHAKAITRCRHCLSEFHTTGLCCHQGSTSQDGVLGHLGTQWVCCHQGFTCQDHTGRYAGSSMRVSAFFGGADISISAPSAASHTWCTSVQSLLPARGSPVIPGIGSQGGWELASSLRTERSPDFSFTLCHVISIIHSCDHWKVC